MALTEVTQKVAHQQRNIFAPLTQRRQADREHVQAVDNAWQVFKWGYGPTLDRNSACTTGVAAVARCGSRCLWERATLGLAGVFSDQKRQRRSRRPNGCEALIGFWQQVGKEETRGFQFVGTQWIAVR